MLFFILFFFLFLIIKIDSNRINNKEWGEGIYKQELDEEERKYDRLLEAYIQLGALMVRKDTESYTDKILYLNSYFSKYFPDTHYDFGRSFTESLKNPVQPKVISKWLRRKLPQTKQRLQIMYFLAGISTVDGSMNKREIDLLKEMNMLLELTNQDFDSIIAMYTQKQERTRVSENSMPRVNKVQLACKILGVQEQATNDEIKKAYRRLVKLHHPDSFATESLEQQEIAEQRFIEIQNAYELLVKN